MKPYAAAIHTYFLRCIYVSFPTSNYILLTLFSVQFIFPHKVSWTQIQMLLHLKQYVSIVMVAELQLDSSSLREVISHTWWGVSSTPLLTSTSWKDMAKFWWLSAVKGLLALEGKSTLQRNHPISNRCYRVWPQLSYWPRGIHSFSHVPGGLGANALVFIHHREVHVGDSDLGGHLHFELVAGEGTV